MPKNNSVYFPSLIFLTIIPVVVFMSVQSAFVINISIYVIMFLITVTSIYTLVYRDRLQMVLHAQLWSYMALFTAIFLINLTGGLASPLFFIIYVLLISFTFILTLLHSLVLSIVLFVLFAYTAYASGEGVVPVTELIALMSIFSVLPLNFYVSRKYLNVKQSERQILVLREELDQYKNVVDRVLSNRISRFIMDIKQPINDVKQLADYLGEDGTFTREQRETYRQRMVETSAKALTLLDDFERNTTGENLVHTPRKAVAPIE